MIPIYDQPYRGVRIQAWRGDTRVRCIATYNGGQSSVWTKEYPLKVTDATVLKEAEQAIDAHPGIEQVEASNE